MDKNIKPFDYISQTFSIYGVIILILNIFTLLFGDDAMGLSTIFSLGSKGLSVPTMLEFLLAAALISALRVIFMSDLLIKKLSITPRIVLMFASMLALTVAFILIFGWFSSDNIRAWLMFTACYVVSCSVSAFVTDIKEKQENKKLNDALSKLKEEL